MVLPAKKHLIAAARGAVTATLIAAAILCAPTAQQPADAVPPDFDYQAQIIDSTTGNPINSTDVTITLRLYPSATASIPLKTINFSNLDLSSSGGYVNLSLDSSGLNLNGDVYVEVTVDDNTDSQPAETLSPRQKVNSVLFALNAATLEGDSLAAVRAYADNAAATEADQALQDAKDYTDAQIAALNLNGGGGVADLSALGNFNRVLFVNPDADQNQGTAQIPDGLVVGDNPDVTPPHIIEFNTINTSVDHVFVGGTVPTTAGVAEVRYTVDGDALSPGSTFNLQVQLTNNVLNQDIGGIAFSVFFNELDVQPTGSAANVSGSPIQFEQLITTNAGGGRLNIAGAITSAANTSDEGMLFEIPMEVVSTTPLDSSPPTGTLDNPFDNIPDAYNYAKTLPDAGNFFQRIAIYLMPGEHVLDSPLNMDTVGIDLVGFGNQQAFIRGTADPMIRYTAGTSGAWMYNLNIRPSGASNTALEALAGGRVRNCVFNRPSSAGPTQGTLISLNLPSTSGISLAFRDFEIYGDVNIQGYGSQTTFTDGFILGTVTSTGTVGTSGNEFLSFSNMSTIGGIDFQPAGSGTPGILGISNVSIINAINYDTDTVLQASLSNFVDSSNNPLTLPDPAVGSVVSNCLGTGSNAWTGTVINNPANIPGFQTLLAVKTP